MEIASLDTDRPLINSAAKHEQPANPETDEVRDQSSTTLR